MKYEFSKLVLGGVMILYFSGAVFGGVIVADEPAMLGELLAYIGAPTAAAIGFYAWKARAENIVKISKDRKLGTASKKQIITSISGTSGQDGTEGFGNGA